LGGVGFEGVLCELEEPEELDVLEELEELEELWLLLVVGFAVLVVLLGLGAVETELLLDSLLTMRLLLTPKPINIIFASLRF